MHEWVDLGLKVLTLLLAAVIFPTIRLLMKIRSNDLHKLQESIERVEAKLDRHIQYHLEYLDHGIPNPGQKPPA